VPEGEDADSIADDAIVEVVADATECQPTRRARSRTDGTAGARSLEEQIERTSEVGIERVGRFVTVR